MHKALMTFPALLLAGACSTTPALTPPTALPLAEQAEVEESAPEGHHAEEGEHKKNAINLFLGGATNQADDTGFTFGVDYEHKYTPQWGAGVFGEGVTGELRSFVGGALAFYHPIEPLAIVAGPGLERERGTEFGSAHWSAMFRVGGFYEFPLNQGWTLAPAVYYDFAEGDNTFIFGFNVGTSF